MIKIYLKRNKNADNVGQLNSLLDALNVSSRKKRGQPIKRAAEITVPLLVEVHCALMKLNYDDYIPSQNSIRDVESIILSLRDRFGKEKFHHLDPIQIANMDNTQLGFLLQIFKLIFDHLTSKGELSFHPESVDESSFDSTIGDIRVNYENQEDDEEQLYLPDVNHYDQVGIPQGEGEHPGAVEVIQNLSRIDPNEETPRKKNIRKQRRNVDRTSENKTPPRDPNSSGSKSQHFRDEAQLSEKTTSDSNRFEVFSDSNLEGSDLNDISVRDDLLEDLSRRNQDEIDSQLQDKLTFLPGENLLPKDPVNEINLLHDDIEEFIRGQLTDMECQIALLRNRKCCDDEKSKSSKKAIDKRKANPANQKFPNYPYGIIRPKCGNIKMKPSKSLKKRQPFTLSCVNVNCCDPYLGEEDHGIVSQCDKPGKTGEGESKDSKENKGALENKSLKASSQFCNIMMKQIRREVPGVQLDEQTVNSMKKMCHDHIRKLKRTEIDDSAISKELLRALKDFVSSNQSKLNMQRKIENAQKRREKLLEERRDLVRVQASRHSLKYSDIQRQKVESDINDALKKVAGNRFRESKMILNTFRETLEEELKSVVRLRKEKRQRACKLFAEATQHLKSLQALYDGELKALREEYILRRGNSDPKTEERLHKLWTECRDRLQKEINKCVDKIINNISSIYF